MKSYQNAILLVLINLSASSVLLADIQTESNLVLSRIKAADARTAEKNVAALQRDFANSPQLADKLVSIAWAYAERPERFKQAKDLFNSVAKDFPKSSAAADARVYSILMDARIKLRSGDIAGVEAVIRKMRTENSSNPALPNGLYNIAWAYADRPEYFEQAKDLFNSVAKDFPNSSQAVEARLYGVMMDAKLNLEEKDIAGVEAVIAKIRTENPSNPALPNALYNIAWAYAGRPECLEQAKDLFNSVAKDFPNSSRAVEARLYSVMTDARLKLRDGDIAGVEAVIAKIRTENSSNPVLPNGLYNIAWAYAERPEWFGQAKDLFNSVAKDFPDSSVAADARFYGTVMDVLALIVSQDYAQSKISLDKLIANFNENSYLPERMLDIAEMCYKKAVNSGIGKESADKMLHLSCELLEKYVVGKTAGSTLTIAYYTSGLNYDKLGEYEKAAIAFKNAHQTDPKFKYADYCLFAQGYCYEELMENQLVTETEAKPQITSHYSKLLADCPQSKYAPYARGWLQSNK